jgi:hypothetical protein
MYAESKVMYKYPVHTIRVWLILVQIHFLMMVTTEIDTLGLLGRLLLLCLHHPTATYHVQ